MKQGKLFVISGPSGVGKGTIVDALLTKNSDLYWAKSYTTRRERQSDESENHYIFVDKDEFNRLRESGEILEANFYNGSWYGSSKSEIFKAINSGRNVVKEVEVNGGLFYKKTFPKAILIFIKADIDDIKRRLIKRRQNSKEEINDRLEIAKKEFKVETDYDYSVVNPEGHPEVAVEKLHKIVQNEIKNNNL